MSDQKKIPDNIVFYDGVCVLCNRFMQFLMHADKRNQLYFSTLQSDFANDVLKDADFNHADLKTMVLKKGDRIMTQSTAALNMYRMLGFPWSMLYVFILVPPFIRDAVYKIVAKYRYKIFGKEENCILPDAHLRAKIIE